MKISHRWFAVASLLVSLISLPCSAANFTLEQVMSSPFPSNLVAAKRSGSVAWVFNAKGVRNLWIADAPNFAARQVTHYSEDDGVPISSLRITPDGRTLVYVRGSELNENGRVADPTNGVSARKQQVWAADADGEFSPRWSPVGERIAFMRLPGRQEKLPLIPVRVTPWSIWVADTATGNGKEIWHSGNTPNDSFPELAADSSFYFAANDQVLFASEQDGWNHLYSIPAGGGAPTLLTPGNLEVEDVTLSADQKSALFSSNQEDVDRRHIWRVALDGGKPQALSHGETIEWIPVESAGQMVCLGSSATTPAMPYRINGQGRQMLAAAALPADFPSKQLVTPKQVTFKSEDGLEIHGQLFVPAERRQAGPALIFVHGGPIRQMMLGFHYMYYYHNAYAMNQYLASRGYVVLSVNYRLGIMYGRAFREAANAGWRGSSEYKDVVAGVKFLQCLPIVDAKRIGLWGGSYGGLLTALGLARNSDIFAAGVDMHGVHDWSVFLPHWEKRPGAPDQKEAEKLAFESSPDASVATWKSPVLLIHGDDDRNVPFGQTVDLAQRLREQKVYFEEVIFPDEIHDFLIWRNWVRAYGASVDFFDKELR